MSRIALSIRYCEDIRYPRFAPFDADDEYIELENKNTSVEANTVYRAVRECFADLGMDKENFGTKEWSPLSEIVLPGNTVVIKPNFVLNTANQEIQECTTTHPSVIRPIIDYCWKAMEGRGRIIVGDACGAEADFDEIVERTKTREMIEILKKRGINVELEDFRAVRVTTENGIWTGEQKVNRNVATSQIVNIGKESLFCQPRYESVKLHGAGYDINETTRHHRGDIQEYCVSKSILSADVVISIPKLKTHRKAGLTCCLKNLVGINADKNYLPHFTMGSVNMGGDEMPAIDEKNIWRVKLYNAIRENIIAYSWRLVGKPSAILLRLSMGRKNRKDSARAIEASANSQIVHSKTDVDLAKRFHNMLSGQQVAAGAWPGNETICNMILDLNKIFLRCDTNGVMQKRTNRKIFYVVDAVVSGMGNGPTHPIPTESKIIAAGWNGLKIDTTLLNLFGIDEDSLLLYKKAKDAPWMYDNSDGKCLYNGREISKNDRVPINFIAPDGWEYSKK